jgi:hypothetical protein
MKLNLIQSELKAPKNQRNTFGNYNYRSAEDILEAVKPLLLKHECSMTISDTMIEVGGRIYVKATVDFQDGEKSVSVSAFAREEETKKGMDAAQITGSASSYARKYALNGMFLIDDTKDPDATNDHGKGNPREEKKPKKVDTDTIILAVKMAKTKDELVKIWQGLDPDTRGELQEVFSQKKAEL